MEEVGVAVVDIFGALVIVVGSSVDGNCGSVEVVGASVDDVGESAGGDVSVVVISSVPSPDTSSQPSPEQAVSWSSHSANCSSSAPSDVSDSGQSGSRLHLQAIERFS